MVKIDYWGFKMQQMEYALWMAAFFLVALVICVALLVVRDKIVTFVKKRKKK